jgi:hypothetical protein
VLILKRAPETLDVDVCQGFSKTIHADRNAPPPQVVYTLGAGKMTALVAAVQNFGRPVLGNDLPQILNSALEGRFTYIPTFFQILRSSWCYEDLSGGG